MDQVKEKATIIISDRKEFEEFLSLLDSGNFIHVQNNGHVFRFQEFDTNSRTCSIYLQFDIEYDGEHKIETPSREYLISQFEEASKWLQEKKDEFVKMNIAKDTFYKMMKFAKK